MPWNEGERKGEAPTTPLAPMLPCKEGKARTRSAAQTPKSCLQHDSVLQFGCVVSQHKQHTHKTHNHNHTHWRRTIQSRDRVHSAQAGMLFVAIHGALLACFQPPSSPYVTTPATLQKHTKTTTQPHRPLIQTRAHADGTLNSSLHPLDLLAAIY